MRNFKILKRKKFGDKEMKREKNHTRIFYFFLFAYLFYYFFRPETIGHDYRYLLFVFVIPFVVGIISLAIYRKDYIKNQLQSVKSIIWKFFLLFFYLIQAFVFSLTSFSLLTNIAWDMTCKLVASKNRIEMINCQIDNFHKGGRRQRASINFYYKNNYESLHAKSEIINKYTDKNPSDYYIEIKTRKGIWNYYVVEDWEIVSNNKD